MTLPTQKISPVISALATCTRFSPLITAAIAHEIRAMNEIETLVHGSGRPFSEWRGDFVRWAGAEPASMSDSATYARRYYTYHGRFPWERTA